MYFTLLQSALCSNITNMYFIFTSKVPVVMQVDIAVE